MKTVVSGTKGLSVADLISKALVLEVHMMGNPNFPNAGPFVAAVTAAREALEVAMVDAMDGGRSAHGNQRALKQRLKDAITRLQLHVSNVANGDAVKLLSSGLALRKPPLKLGPLPAPLRLVAVHGIHQGELHLRWVPVHGARIYEVFINEGDPDNAADWRSVGFVSHAHFEFQGLASLRYYWFRVRALGAAGASPFSDPARSVVI